MSKSKPYIPLTIKRLETKALILASEKEVKMYAKRRKFAGSTLARILLTGNSAYPYQVREKSTFQKILRKIQADGYLVEESCVGGL
jgi:hypothetical protein